MKLTDWYANLPRSKKRFLLFIFVSIIIGIIIACGIVYITQTRWKKTIYSYGIIKFDKPYLTIQVSPPGYPLIGDSWDIYVFERFPYTDSSPSAYKPASNATVTVFYSTKHGAQETYELTVDENGKVTFQFFQEIKDIAFQAFSQGFTQSNIVIISDEYVSPTEVDSFFTFGIVTFVASLFGSSWAIWKDKIWRWQKIFLFIILLDFSIITVFSTYSKLFMSTIWGYPENIFGGIITFTTLKILYFCGLMFLILIVMIFIFLFNPKIQKMEDKN